MFERFTDRARRVVVLAQEEARLLNHNYIGSEHLLLGLLHEGEGVAALALDALGVTLEAAREQVRGIVGAGQSTPGGNIPFTPRAKKIMELSLREALALGHNYIGTEHLLLGLAREREGVGAQVLTSLQAGMEQVREAVMGLLSGSLPTRVAQPAGLVRREPFVVTPWSPPSHLEHLSVLARVVPIASSHDLEGGYRLIVISIEVWKAWFDLRFALVATDAATGEPPLSLFGDLWAVSDDADTAYRSLATSCSGGSVVQIGQHSFTPPPPEGAHLLTLALTDRAGAELLRVEVPLGD